MATTLRPLSTGELLDRTFSLYRSHFTLFFGIFALPHLCVLAVQCLAFAFQTSGTQLGNVLTTAAFGMLAGLLGMVVAAASQAATVVAVSNVHLDRPASVMDSFSKVKHQIAGVIGLSLKMGILVGLACLALIVPGILLMIRWSLAVPAKVLENKSSGEAMSRSSELSHGNRGRIFVIWFLFMGARNLHAAAKRIVTDFHGQIPSRVDELTALPGIGRYTAGAIASIAFDRRAPILDGNVARVLCRLEKIRTDPRKPQTIRKLWKLAEKILPSRHCGQFNSALMELGATVCTPRQPRCSICPVRSFCRAAAAGLQETMPPPRKSRPTPILARWTICIHHNHRWLLERRPTTGRWAGLWQFPTIKADQLAPTAAAISQHLGLAIANLREIGQIRHALTHRRYVFTAFIAAASVAPRFSNRKWIRLQELDDFPLSRPQLGIAELLRASDFVIRT